MQSESKHWQYFSCCQCLDSIFNKPIKHIGKLTPIWMPQFFTKSFVVVIFFIVSSTCSQSIMEDLSLGASICTLDVMDADQVAPNTEFSLAVSGFSISPSYTEFGILYTDGALTAELLLRSSLDFESVKSYPLFITVSFS